MCEHHGAAANRTTAGRHRFIMHMLPMVLKIIPFSFHLRRRRPVAAPRTRPANHSTFAAPRLLARAATGLTTVPPTLGPPLHRPDTGSGPPPTNARWRGKNPTFLWPGQTDLASRSKSIGSHRPPQTRPGPRLNPVVGFGLHPPPKFLRIALPGYHILLRDHSPTPSRLSGLFQPVNHRSFDFTPRYSLQGSTASSRLPSRLPAGAPATRPS